MEKLMRITAVILGLVGIASCAAAVIILLCIIWEIGSAEYMKSLFAKTLSTGFITLIVAGVIAYVGEELKAA